MLTEVLYIGDRLRDLRSAPFLLSGNWPRNPAWALPPSSASSATR